MGAPLETSDHCEITCQLKFSKNTNKAFSRSVWDYNKADWEGLNTSLSKHNWDDCFTAAHVSSCAQLWTETFLSYARRFIPNKLLKYVHGTNHGIIMSSVRKNGRETERLK